MRFHRAQPPRARDRGVIWRRLGQPQFSKLAQPQRIRRPPRDATLPLNPFEISDQQQAKIPPRRQRRTPHRLRVGSLTLPLYNLVEPTLLQQLVQPLVERMCHRPRPLRVGNPKLFLRLPLLRSSSHHHARSLRTSALDYARNFTSESRLSPRTASSRRPGAPAGCSRCERCPDTASACAASSTVVPPTCVPLPPWPPLSASGDSDADTLYETRDRNAPRSAPLPPATCAACGCPAW